MPAFVALSRSCSRPHWFVLALIALSASGCSSDISRFESPFSNPFASQSAPANDVTGSVRAPAPTSQVQSQALPPVAGHASAPLPPPPRSGGSDITGSVAKSGSARGWDWDGGTAITVTQGDTIDTISHRYGVPPAAIMQANAITSPAGIYPGQRLVIPRYNANAAASDTKTTAAAPGKPAENGSHVVNPGESLIGIARRYQVPLVELAKANKIEPYAQVKMGQKLTIPGRAVTASSSTQRPAPPQQAAAKPLAAPPQKVASAEPAHTARALTPANDTPAADDTGKTADASGPGFRWPARGRIIAGFGPKPNGQQNDGINLAVPEGTPVKAAEDGVVAYAGNELKGYGNLVLVRHPNGFVTAYAHASELLVKRGDQIKRGQVIARSGQTGTVTSPQLHFEIRKGSAPVDPMQYLSGA